MQAIDYDEAIPDHLCCEISMEIMTDPVLLVGAGRTYERATIVAWLKNNSNRCPQTNKVLSADGCKLIPNFGIKSAIEAFITEKESAFKARPNPIS